MCLKRNILAFFQDKSCRCRNFILPEKLFGKSLIHGNRTSQITTSRITDTKQVKSCLYFSVLTVFAVQCQEHNICCLTQCDHIGAKECFSFLNALLYLTVKTSRISGCGIDIVLIGKCLHRICIFSSEIDIHQDSLMTSASKCLAYLCTGYDRYLTLGTDTSC